MTIPQETDERALKTKCQQEKILPNKGLTMNKKNNENSNF
jgi:hypothetical protein